MSIDERIQNWAKAYEQNGYLNGSLLVSVDGKILLSKGYGMANFTHHIPNSPKMKFRIGSLTKAFTAFSIFQLHEIQKLHVNDEIGKYLPGYPNGDRITIYHCLTNTSGIPNYTSFPDFWVKTMRLTKSLDELIDSFMDKELEFEPGSQFSYSNSGYTLLTAIIEKVSEMSYADYIEENICKVLGMVNTGCDDGVKVVRNLASGYSYWEEPIHAAFADMSFPLGAYGLYSTTEDLFLWDQALRTSQFVSKDIREKIMTPFRDSYACGWMVSTIEGRKCVHHFGDVSGYSSDFLRFVDDQVTIIFLSNINVTPVTHLTRELAKVIFGEPVNIPIPINPLKDIKCESFIGTYKYERNKTLEISLKEGNLYVTVPKMYDVPYKFRLVPVSQAQKEVTFVTEMIDEKFVFQQTGEMVYTDYYGQSYQARKERKN